MSPASSFISIRVRGQDDASSRRKSFDSLSRAQVHESQVSRVCSRQSEAEPSRDFALLLYADSCCWMSLTSSISVRSSNGEDSNPKWL